MTLLGLGVREEAVRRAGRLTFREVSAAAALVHFAPFAFLIRLVSSQGHTAVVGTVAGSYLAEINYFRTPYIIGQCGA